MYVLVILGFGIFSTFFLLNYPREDFNIAEEGRKLRAEIPLDFDQWAWDYWTWVGPREEISGRWLPGKGAKAVVFFHGTGTNYRSMIKYSKVFKEKGYGLVFFDWPWVDVGSTTKPGFGFWEFSEGKMILEHLQNIHPEIDTWGVFGESLGGSVALTLTENPQVVFSIADCPFSNFYELCGEFIKKRMGILGVFCGPWITRPALFLCQSLTKNWGGFSLENGFIMNILRNLKDPIPHILLIHGLDDVYVHHRHSTKLFKTIQSPNGQIHLVPGARHAKSWRVDPQSYELIISKFLRGLDDGT